MQSRERHPHVSDQRQKDLVCLFRSLLDNWYYLSGQNYSIDFIQILNGQNQKKTSIFLHLMFEAMFC